MDRVLSILETQDHFYSSFQLYFNGKLRIHSLYSTLFSIIINCTCIAMFITLLIELITHSKPTVTFAKLNNHVTTNMTLNTKELLYTIGLRDKYYQDLTDPSIVTLEPLYVKMTAVNGELTEELIPLDFINCTTLYPQFDSIGLGSVFNSTGLSSYNCYNGTTANKPIVIGGKYGSDFYGNLAFNIRKCVNGTSSSGIICKTEAEINEAVQDAWLQVTYVSSYIDFNNFSTPIQYITEDFFTNIDTKLTKITYQYFNPVYIYSENNIIFSNYKVEGSTKGEKQTVDIISPKEDGLLYLLYVCPSYTIEKYYRRYVKIQELGASVGGFWSGISIFWFLFFTQIQIRDIQMKLVNSLFEFRSSKQLDPKRSVFVPIADNNNRNYNYRTSCSMPSPKKTKTSHFNLSSANKVYKADFGLGNTLKMALCQFDSKVKKMNQEYKHIFKEVMNYYDVNGLFHNMQDVNRLKGILGSKGTSSKTANTLSYISSSKPQTGTAEGTGAGGVGLTQLEWPREKRVFNIDSDFSDFSTNSSCKQGGGGNITNQDYDSKNYIKSSHNNININNNNELRLNDVFNYVPSKNALYRNSQQINTPTNHIS